MPVKTLNKAITLDDYLTASKISIKNQAIAGWDLILLNTAIRINLDGFQEMRNSSSGMWYLNDAYNTRTPALTVKEINDCIKNGYVVKLHTPVKKWYDI